MELVKLKLTTYNLNQSEDNKKKCIDDLWDNYGIQIKMDKSLLILRYQRWYDKYNNEDELTKYCRGSIFMLIH